MEIVLATRNRKKADELARICSDLDIRILTLDAFPGCPEVEEDGTTFRQNALKKAREVARFTGRPTLSDDSGLAVDALEGAPGVYSARYAGPKADDRRNVTKLLKKMADVPERGRQARFVCCIAFVLPDGHHKTFTGTVKGRISRRRLGRSGFGYDPVFFPEGHDRTFAQMSAAEKDSLSHRGRALHKLHRFLRTL